MKKWMCQNMLLRKTVYISVAGSDETLLIAEVDLPGAFETRKKKPYTSLRRPELYK
jgi:hypothetical protein